MIDFKKIKLVALDLDDTTLRSDSTLAPETAQAIKDALSAGIEVVVASGRAYRSLPKSVIGIEGINYAVTSNGAAIERVPSGERVMNFTLDDSSVEQILQVYKDEMLECFIDGHAYCEKEYYDDPLGHGSSEAYVEYVKTTRTPIENIPRFMREHIHEIDSVDVLCGSIEHKNELWSKTGLIQNVYVTSSSPRLIEISNSSAGKGASLKRLCRLIGVSSENVAAFGNGENDADMLRFAGIGVAVGNAVDKCKAAADYICETNDEFGVAKTLRMML